jgi:acyl-coenzyme A synthetase/AMP-(fatty) acid ligase
MLRGIWGDPQRFKDVYWSEVKGSYFTGMAAARTKTVISGSSGASTTF